MARRTKTKKTTTRNAKVEQAGKKLSKKEMRFSISLVILMGMLIFSMLLLLVSLNKSVVVKAKENTAKIVPVKYKSGLKKTVSQVLNDTNLDFKITVPTEIGEWLYKIGEVKSLTDNKLSNQYLRIFTPLAGTKSNNFDQQNKDILTIRRFRVDEWDDITKKCQKEENDTCDAAGTLIAKETDSNGDEWVYAYTKPNDCPKSIEAKCKLIDKIINSFSLK